MENLPTKKPDSAITKTEYKDIEHFQMFLNKAPAKKEIKTNPFAGNSQYIPIAIIEQRLDEIYAGLWSVTDCALQVVANSIVCSLVLEVVHPMAKITLRRAGVGAIPIQLNKDEKEMSFSTIKSDAIRKKAPAAKSQALRNAAQSLGMIFGRGLNREDVADYQPISEQVEQFEPLYDEAMDLLKSSIETEQMKQSIERNISRAGTDKLKSIIDYLKGKQK
jgi:hypothetical protein